VKNLGTTTAALAAIAVTTALAAAAPAGSATARKIPFSAKYAGTAVTQANDTLVTIAAKGTGTGVPIGRGTLTGGGTADSSVRPCVPFGGTGKLTGTNRTTVAFKVVSGSKGCSDEEGQVFTITGRAAVTKATGKLARAKGSLKFTGTYDRSAGTFSVKFTGTLTA